MATFRPIDDAATTGVTNQPLDTALLKDMAESIEATRATRTRNAVRHYTPPQRACVLPGLGYFGIPIIWPHDETETEITVRVLGIVGSQVGPTPGTDPEISIAIGYLSLSDVVVGRPVTVAIPTDLAYNAAEQVVTFTLTPTDDPVGMVWVLFKSYLGAWADVTDGAGGTGSTITPVGADWDYGGAAIAGVATPAWGTADSVPTQAIRITDSTGKVEDGLPGPRQIIYLEYDTPDHIAHVWPPYGRAGAALLDAGDKWQYADLGYMDVTGIEVYTSGTTVGSVRDGALLDAGSPPAALAPLSLQQQSDTHQALVTRVHGIGQGGFLYADGDGTPNTLDRAAVWGNQSFTFEGVEYQRQALSGVAILAPTHVSNDAGTSFAFASTVAVTATDLDGSTDSYEVSSEGADLVSDSAPASWREPPHSPGPTLWGWRLAQAPTAHALSGLYGPQDYGGSWYIHEFSGVDDQAGTAGDTRLMTLTVDQESNSDGGDVFQYAHHVHLVTWSMWTTPATALTIAKIGGDIV